MGQMLSLRWRPLPPINGGGNDIEPLFLYRSHRLNLRTQEVFVCDRTSGGIQDFHNLTRPDTSRSVCVLLQKLLRGFKRKDHLTIGVVHMTMGRPIFLRRRIRRVLRLGSGFRI